VASMAYLESRYQLSNHYSGYRVLCSGHKLLISDYLKQCGSDWTFSTLSQRLYYLRNASASAIGTANPTPGPTSPSHSKRYSTGATLFVPPTADIPSAVRHGCTK